MHPHAELIHRFYTAFQARDGEGMAACYHPEVRFSDPVFPELHGAAAGNMWRMLTSRGKDLEVSVSGVEADDTSGKAHWEAWYTFSASGRRVHNVIDASFEFRDGLIVKHTDVFDLWKWTRMALGLPGMALGWSGFLQNKVRDQAAAGLASWTEEHG